MTAILFALGFAVYAACVDFMLNLAAILHVTYRDANTAVLLIGFPATTAVLAVVCAWQRVVLRRERAKIGRAK
ncbi:MAG TPA: hypothetical protein VMV18_05645 [bacterium]|nr:hypothetical protein [bacterium]